MKSAILALILPLALAGTTDLDEVSIVYLAPGSSEYLEISSNPTTGYSWVVNSYKSDCFTIEDGGYIPDDTGDRVMSGSGGTQVFIAHANSTCAEGDTTQIEFLYVRSWEANPAYSKEVTFYATNDYTLLNM